GPSRHTVRDGRRRPRRHPPAPHRRRPRTRRGRRPLRGRVGAGAVVPAHGRRGAGHRARPGARRHPDRRLPLGRAVLRLPLRAPVQADAGQARRRPGAVVGATGPPRRPRRIGARHPGAAHRGLRLPEHPLHPDHPFCGRRVRRGQLGPGRGRQRRAGGRAGGPAGDDPGRPARSQDGAGVGVDRRGASRPHRCRGAFAPLADGEPDAGSGLRHIDPAAGHDRGRRGDARRVPGLCGEPAGHVQWARRRHLRARPPPRRSGHPRMAAAVPGPAPGPADRGRGAASPAREPAVHRPPRAGRHGRPWRPTVALGRLWCAGQPVRGAQLAVRQPVPARRARIQRRPDRPALDRHRDAGGHRHHRRWAHRRRTGPARGRRCRAGGGDDLHACVLLLRGLADVGGGHGGHGGVGRGDPRPRCLRAGAVPDRPAGAGERAGGGLVAAGQRHRAHPVRRAVGPLRSHRPGHVDPVRRAVPPGRAGAGRLPGDRGPRARRPQPRRPTTQSL
ncbi:MAG: hypothetical protein AVDCRST_MAG10-3093, partial [uncultured Acidimicrobiales bacterium]